MFEMKMKNSIHEQHADNNLNPATRSIASRLAAGSSVARLNPASGFTLIEVMVVIVMVMTVMTMMIVGDAVDLAPYLAVGIVEMMVQMVHEFIGIKSLLTSQSYLTVKPMFASVQAVKWSKMEKFYPPAAFMSRNFFRNFLPV